MISSFFSATAGISILFKTTTWGFEASSGEKSWSSLFIAAKSPNGSTLSPFTIWTIILHLSICLKNPLPRPTPYEIISLIINIVISNVVIILYVNIFLIIITIVIIVV